MELTMIKDGNKWVAEIEVAGDFNLHVEKGAGVDGYYFRMRDNG